MAKINIANERIRLFTFDLEEAQEAYRLLKQSGWNTPTPSEECRLAVLDQRFADCGAHGVIGHRQLIQSVYLFRSDRSALDKIFAELSAAKDPLLIGDLASLLYLRESGVAKYAGRLVSELWQYLTVGDLRRLDLVCRRHLPGWFSYWDSDVEPYFKYLPTTLVEPARSGISSFHANGYIRERALQSVVHLSEEMRVPLLMIRMTDWVEPVQRIVEKALADDLQVVSLGVLVGAASLREMLATNSRYAASGMDATFRQRLNCVEAREAFALALEERNPGLRRHTIRLGLTLDCISESIVQLGRKDKDPFNRLEVTRWLKRNYSSVFARDLEAFLVDKSAAVRRLAIQILRKEQPNEFRVFYERGLLDTSAAIRSYVQYFAGKDGVNCQSIYDKAIAEAHGKQLSAAVAGWAETGGAAKRLEPFVEHPRTKVKRAAIRGLWKIDPGSYTHLFKQQLVDANPGVSREGMSALQYDIYSLPHDWFWEVLATTPYDHVRCNVYRLLALQNKWDAMTALARGLSEKGRVREVVDSLLGRLISQPPWVFPRLKTERVEALDQAWADLNLGRFAKRMRQLLEMARTGKL